MTKFDREKMTPVEFVRWMSAFIANKDYLDDDEVESIHNAINGIIIEEEIVKGSHLSNEISSETKPSIEKELKMMKTLFPEVAPDYEKYVRSIHVNLDSSISLMTPTAVTDVLVKKFAEMESRIRALEFMSNIRR